MKKIPSLLLFAALLILMSTQPVAAVYPATLTKDYPSGYININFDETGFVSFGGGALFKKVIYINFTIQVPLTLSNGSGFNAELWVDGRTCLNKANMYPEFLVQMQFKYLKGIAGYQTINALDDDEYFYNYTIPVAVANDYFQLAGQNLFTCYSRINIYINTTKYAAPFAAGFQFKFDSLKFSGAGGVSVVSDFTTSLFEFIPLFAVSLTIPFAVFIMFGKKPKAFGFGCILSGLVTLFGELEIFAVSIGFIVIGCLIFFYTNKRSEE